MEQNSYEDIIDLPHHVSSTRPQMPMRDRAAQFSPFAALTGYGEAVEEEQRITEEERILEEPEKEILDAKLQILMSRLADHPQVTITYFQKDARKDGGSYLTVTGRLSKIDTYRKALVLESGERIPSASVYDISSALFWGYFEDADGIELD